MRPFKEALYKQSKKYIYITEIKCSAVNTNLNNKLYLFGELHELDI